MNLVTFQEKTSVPFLKALIWVLSQLAHFPRSPKADRNMGELQSHPVGRAEFLLAWLQPSELCQHTIISGILEIPDIAEKPGLALQMPLN